MGIMAICLIALTFAAFAFAFIKLAVFAGNKVGILSYRLIVWGQKTFQTNQEDAQATELSRHN